jgi:hypothetical protein
MGAGVAVAVDAVPVAEVAGEGRAGLRARLEGFAVDVQVEGTGGVGASDSNGREHQSERMHANGSQHYFSLLRSGYVVARIAEKLQI